MISAGLVLQAIKTIKYKLNIFQYFLFFCNKTSRSRFLSDRRFRFPHVLSPAVEKTHSTGAEDPGVIKTSFTTVDSSSLYNRINFIIYDVWCTEVLTCSGSKVKALWQLNYLNPCSKRSRRISYVFHSLLGILSHSSAVEHWWHRVVPPTTSISSSRWSSNVLGEALISFLPANEINFSVAKTDLQSFAGCLSSDY